MASAAEQLAANLNFGAFQRATELQKRIGFTLIALVIYRLGTYVPIPGIDAVQFAAQFQQNSQGILGMFNMFSGGAVERMAIFALNVMPYISASIIVQLLQTVYPPWEKLKKEGGEAGRKQLNQYTRYLTVVLALFQSFGTALGMQSVALDPGPFFIVSTVVTLTGGTMFLMWLGEQITSRGVGNGISLLIFAGIVAVLPRSVWQLFQQAQVGSISPLVLFGLLGMAIAVVLFIVFMERSQRRLLIQYPKRQQGNRMVGGESSFLPLKVNTAGVIPPIFASSLLLLPTTVITMMAGQANPPEWMQTLQPVLAQLQHGRPLFMALYAALIIFFCFFY
ncbi:MAG: preprotein translocase subunit SecY, partial [Caulobacter sp.]